MSLPYERHIRFADVEAAGFCFFANYLVLCHEAYEANLRASGIELRSLFVSEQVLLPIAKSQAQYLGPLQSGDLARVKLARHRLSETSFRLDYQIVNVTAQEKLVALAQTEHAAIDLKTLERKPLPAPLVAWLTAGK